MRYIGSKYIHDAWTAGEPFPVEDKEVMPADDAIAAFDKYFEEAPYIFDRDGLRLSYEIEDGYVKVNSKHLLEKLWYATRYDIFDGSAWTTDLDKINWGYMIFGSGTYSAGLGYEYIVEDFPDYEMFVNKSYKEMYDYYVATVDKEDDGYELLEFYEEYIENEAYFQQMNEFFDNYCSLTLDMGQLVFYVPCGKYSGIPEDMQADIDANGWEVRQHHAYDEFVEMYDIFYEVASVMKEKQLFK